MMSHGKSLRLTQNTFIEPLHVELPEVESSSTRTRRRGSVYDAVAGRINLRGNRTIEPHSSRFRDTVSSSSRALRPEEALFRQKSDLVPEGDYETYFANEDLPADRALPSSDLLEAIHAYTADYYEYATVDRGLDDHQSMDETALIAMGILIEEMARESLGETGDLVLVEGQDHLEEHAQEASESDVASRATGRILRRKRPKPGASSSIVRSEDGLSGVRRKLKRRKVMRRASTTDTDTGYDERT